MDSKINSKGQATIPKQVRDALRLKSGDKLLWHFEDGRVIVRAKNRSIKEAAGTLHRPGQRTVSVEEMDEAIGRAAADGAMGGLKSRR